MKRYLIATGFAIGLLAAIGLFHKEAPAPEVAKAPLERKAICVLFGQPQIFVESDKIHITLDGSVVNVRGTLEDGSAISLAVSLSNCAVETHG